MPNLPISQLPELAASAVTVNAEFAVAQSGTTYKVKKENIFPAPVVVGFFSQTGNSTIISGTTTETSLIGSGVGTLTVPSGGFSIGDSFRVVMGGVLSANNNDDIRIRVKANGGTITLADSGFQNLGGTSGQEVFTLELNFTVRNIGSAGVASIVTLGTFTNFKTANGTNTGFAFNQINSTTFNTTITNTLDITAEWDNASANNIIYSDIFTLRKTY